MIKIKLPSVFNFAQEVAKNHQEERRDNQTVPFKKWLILVFATTFPPLNMLVPILIFSKKFFKNGDNINPNIVTWAKAVLLNAVFITFFLPIIGEKVAVVIYFGMYFVGSCFEWILSFFKSFLDWMFSCCSI